MDFLEPLVVVVGVAGLGLALCLPGFRAGLDLADEGYLWFGCQQVLDGRLPIRDFRAYEPGRYYWHAFWMRFLGRDLPSLRISLVATQVLALIVGTGAILLATGDGLAAILGALLLAPWLFPHHKAIDHLMSMCGSLIVVFVAMDPTPGHVAIAGAFVGAALFMGLNHAIYAAAGITTLVGMMVIAGHASPAGPTVGAYAFGLAIGVGLPLLFILSPRGMAAAYWRHKVVRVLSRQSANLPLPLPWLWRPTPVQLLRFGPRGRVFLKACFTAAPIIAGGLLIDGVARGVAGHPEAWASAGCGSLGLFYLHHAFSRADVSHLAQSIGPLLVGCAILADAHPLAWLPLLLLAAAAATIVWYPVILRPRIQVQGWSDFVDAGGSPVGVSSDMANTVQALRTLVDAHSRKGDSVFFVPLLPGLYPLLSRRPAAYDTFCVYPASEGDQEAMISQLESSKPRLAVVAMHPLDDREDLCFFRTHSAVWRYLHKHFIDLGAAIPASPSLHVFVARCGASPDRGP